MHGTIQIFLLQPHDDHGSGWLHWLNWLQAMFVLVYAAYIAYRDLRWLGIGGRVEPTVSSEPPPAV